MTSLGRVCVLSLAAFFASMTSPKAAEENCAPVGRTMSALRVMGYQFVLVRNAETVGRAMRFLIEHGLRGAPEKPDGLLVVALETKQSRISLVIEGCIAGMILVDQITAEAFNDVIEGTPPGRDA